jgi:hypothetical protein
MERESGYGQSGSTLTSDVDQHHSCVGQMSAVGPKRTSR